ncbi:MAG: hypothetical protein Q9198_001991 [Flavoplaca austrocitrina]
MVGAFSLQRFESLYVAHKLEPSALDHLHQVKLQAVEVANRYVFGMDQGADRPFDHNTPESISEITSKARPNEAAKAPNSRAGIDATALLGAPAAHLRGGNGGPRPKLESTVQGNEMSTILGGPGPLRRRNHLPKVQR